MEEKNTVSLSQPGADLAALLRLTQQNGEVILKENEQPRYRLIDMEQVTEIEMTDDEKIDFVAARILKKYRRAFEELAK